MSVISTVTDADALTLTVVAEFAANPERVWEVWENPRQLERWWGPPSYPATFIRHDFEVGGESRYYMTGPEGDTPHGYWHMHLIEPSRRLEFANGLAGDDGEPMANVEPMGATVTFESSGGGTRMTTLTTFLDVAQMEKMLEMGMREGMEQAVTQIDEILNADS